MSNSTTFLYYHLDQLTNTILVENLERVNFQNLLLEISRQERCDVVTAVAESHLRQVHGTEGEFLCKGSKCLHLQLPEAKNGNARRVSKY